MPTPPMIARPPLIPRTPSSGVAVGTATSSTPARSQPADTGAAATVGIVSEPQRQDTGATAGVRFVSAADRAMGVLRSINSTTNTQFVSSYQLNFSGDLEVYISEDFIEENNILFAIARRSVDGKSEYFSLNIGSDVEASLVAGATTDAGQTLELEYSPKEAAAIKFGGPIVNPSLDDEIIVPPHRYYCNTIEKQKMSYDSLSSIGAVTQEGISVSATNTTGSITFETTGGAITDVGGVTATGVRENVTTSRFGITSLGGSVTIGSGY